MGKSWEMKPRAAPSAVLAEDQRPGELLTQGSGVREVTGPAAGSDRDSCAVSSMAGSERVKDVTSGPDWPL